MPIHVDDPTSGSTRSPWKVRAAGPKPASALAQ
jgi:hypothetical protein